MQIKPYNLLPPKYATPPLRHDRRKSQFSRRMLRHVVVCCLTAALLAAVVMRMWRLGQLPGLNGDEAWYGNQALQWLAGKPVAWFTPTGNPINLFLVGPLVGLHAYFAPSIGLLRSVSAACGLLALLLNFVLCRRLINRQTAIVSTLLLAISPVAIAYSRFAWDASQTPLAAVLVVYAAVAVQKFGCDGWRMANLIVALALAIYIHPTNLFLLPLAAACCLPKSAWWHRALQVATLTAVVAVAVLPGISVFNGLTLRFLSGTSVYQYISLGSPSANNSLRDAIMAGGLVALMLATGFVHNYRHGNSTARLRDQQLILGLTLSWVTFFLVAGPRGLQPHCERYAMWLLVPAALVLSRAIITVRQGFPRYKWIVEAACTMVAVVAVVDFQQSYFVPLLTSGGNSHLAFRTAESDPKQLALEIVQAQTPDHQPAIIVSRGWWTHQPLAYFAAGNQRVAASSELERPSQATDADSRQFWCAELAGSDEAISLLNRIKTAQIDGEMFACNDYAGRAVVLLFRPTKCSVESLKILCSR
jgi:hypothetical protein